jgi:hypothetical protein
MDFTLNNSIFSSITNNILNIYHGAIRDTLNPNRLSGVTRALVDSRYYNNPPLGGYAVDEEHEYIFPDDDDLSSMVFLDIVTRFGSPADGAFDIKEHRRNKIKKIGKYKKVKEIDSEVICPICLDSLQLGEYKRILECNHCFHKKCIDKWFKKDHSECPMCRKVIL